MRSLNIYTSDDGKARISLRVEVDSIWLSQLEIPELSPDSVVKGSLTVQTEGT